jgi:hypothetical protein
VYKKLEEQVDEPSLEYTLGKSTKIKRRRIKVKESEKIDEKSKEPSSDKEPMKRKTRKELKQEIIESNNDDIFL